ncbi:hypothetical protein, partial [Klebsiella pneumoniae]
MTHSFYCNYLIYIRSFLIVSAGSYSSTVFPLYFRMVVFPSYSKALHFKNSAYQAHFAQGIT